ncbi:MAG: hypothetical protein EOP56_08735 [Sphingobacteriales bacterium]|nr:MAG: hypothetical protein EOP56_08735 [Sphingobacteriales bacterium]
MTNLVIQSFGRESELKRAILTILSFYAHTSQPVNETQVMVFTDNPDYFKAYLDGLPVRYSLLTAEKVKQMRGAIDFLHRMKIALIEEAFDTMDGDLLYTDSDTFFIADPTPLMQTLSPAKSYMHLWEYKFESIKDMPLPAGETFHAYLDVISRGPLKLADGTEMNVTPDLSSWNAGVMLLHRSHAAWLPDVYALTEQTYPGTKNHAAEQYAFSILLQTRTDLKPCDAVVYHYWYRIKKQIIDEFLGTELNTEWAKQPLDKKIAIVKNWIDILPHYFEEHVLTLRDNAIQTFNENKYREGYKWAMKALIKQPMGDKTFLKDVLYHLKRQVTGK